MFHHPDCLPLMEPQESSAGYPQIRTSWRVPAPQPLPLEFMAPNHILNRGHHSPPPTLRPGRRKRGRLVRELLTLLQGNFGVTEKTSKPPTILSSSQFSQL